MEKEKQSTTVEPEIERLEKLEKYYKYFDVESRYGLSFKEFVRRVDTGTWDAWLAG